MYTSRVYEAARALPADDSLRLSDRPFHGRIRLHDRWPMEIKAEEQQTERRGSIINNKMEAVKHWGRGGNVKD